MDTITITRLLILSLVLTSAAALNWGNFFQQEVEDVNKFLHSAVNHIKDQLITHIEYDVDLGYTNSLPTIKTIDPELALTWTSKLRGDLLLSQVNIPGTHDSGTSKSALIEAFSARCQSLTISAQLEAGIRFLDLRVKYKGRGDDRFTPQNLTIHHGIANMHLPFSQVTQQIKSFMNKNSREFIILSFEGVQQNNSKCVLQDASNNVLKYLYQALGHQNVILSQKIPTVEQARGKVWIIGGSWMTFGMQSFMICYDPRQGDSFANCSTGKYYVSGSGVDLKFTVRDKAEQVLKAAYHPTEPDRLKVIGLASVGPIWNWEQRPVAIAVRSYGPNARISQALKNPPKGVTMGLLVADFPGPILIDRIIRSNFAQQTDQTL